MSLSLSEAFLILPKDHFLIGGTRPEGWRKNTKHESAHRKTPCPTDRTSYQKDMDLKIWRHKFSHMTQLLWVSSVCLSVCVCHGNIDIIIGWRTGCQRNKARTDWTVFTRYKQLQYQNVRQEFYMTKCYKNKERKMWHKTVKLSIIPELPKNN